MSKTDMHNTKLTSCENNIKSRRQQQESYFELQIKTKLIPCNVTTRTSK